MNLWSCQTKAHGRLCRSYTSVPGPRSTLSLNSFKVHAIADLLLAAVRLRQERGTPLMVVELEHQVPPRTALIPHRWTLWAIKTACKDFDFRIFRIPSDIPQQVRLNHLFTTAERQRLLDETCIEYAGTDRAADRAANSWHTDDEDDWEYEANAGYSLTEYLVSPF